MSESNIKFKNLVDKLFYSTSSSSIVWSLTDENYPFCIIADYKIVLTSGVDYEGEPMEYITIYNLDGHTVDSFNDNSISAFKPQMGQSFHNYWKVMESLREMAVRQATGADKAIDEIIDALNDNDVPF
ncbi:hypothetical protein [Sphingorhabdus sp.]|uniref:hypothetical protein n=1 Tax=Sphingorhabdus sp. TaxID=1902408 RepID=UPI0035935BFC